MVYEPFKSGQNEGRRLLERSATLRLDNRDEDTDDALVRFVIGHIDWSTHRGGGTTRDRILIAESSQPDELAHSKAEARDWTHITQKKTVRKGETSHRVQPHACRRFAGPVCSPLCRGGDTSGEATVFARSRLLPRFCRFRPAIATALQPGS